MNKMFKHAFKIATISILSFVLVFVLCSCTTSNRTVTKIERKTEAEYPSIDSREGYDFYSRDRLELKIMVPIESGYSTALIKEIENATNTKITLVETSADAYADAITKSLNSPSSMPDLYCRVPDIEFMKDQLAAYPLYDLLMQYAPNYRDHLSVEDWVALTDVETYDVYSIANIREPEYQLSYMIRKDWLDKLDLDIPSTFDDFLACLQAFKDLDPNGNNISDEIPFSGDIRVLRYLFGINTSYYFSTDYDTNEYQAVVNHKNYRKYLTTLQDMYAGELLNNGYVSTGYGENLLAIMSDDTLGACVSYAEYAQLATESLRSNGKTKAEWVGFKLTGPKCDGDKYYSDIASAAGLVHQFCVSSQVSADKAREIVRFLNFFYTESGKKLMNFGVEGTHHESSNGSILLKPEYSSFKSARSAGMLYQGMPFYWSKASYTQMVTGGKALDQLTIGQKCFYNALGIGSYNFVKQAPSINTYEWNQAKSSLERNLDIFETQVINGKIDDNKLDSELAKIQKSFADVDRAGREAYSIIYDLCQNAK